MATKKKRPITTAEAARALVAGVTEGLTRAALGSGTAPTQTQALADQIESLVRKKSTRHIVSVCVARLTHPARNRWEAICADTGVRYWVEIDYVDEAPDMLFCVCCGAKVSKDWKAHGVKTSFDPPDDPPKPVALK